MLRFETRGISLIERPGKIAPDELSHAHMLIRGWLWAFAFLTALLCLYVANGWRLQVVLQSLTILSGLVGLSAMRAGVPIRFVGAATLITATADLSLGSLAQTPFDPTSVFFLGIVPLFAAFLGGARGGALWSAVCGVVGLVTLQVGGRGLTFPDIDPDPVLTMSGNFVMFVGLSFIVARSYTEERELALVKARAADDAKSVFLANVSHEIRTPMNGVLGMTEVLLLDELSAPHREQLEVIRRSGQSLVLLINDLLDVARLEAGHLALLPARLDLHTLLIDIRKLYEPLAAARGLTMGVTIGPLVPRVIYGDALRLRQVLSNLVSNAVKFTEAGGVRLSVLVEGAALRFAVSDTGPGIPLSVRPRLFRRFEQGDASATRRSGGTGLGLALSKEFVQLMGGSLEYEPGVPSGSRFTFAVSLPAAPQSSGYSRVEALAATAGAGQVLVVDDNAVNLMVAKALIGRAGFQVLTATNGREALTALETGPFCLVLMDVQMPEMDGLEATRRIRGLPGTQSQVPIIALTASAMPEDLAACLAAGMNDVLPKPIDPGALALVLQRFVS